MNKQQHTVLDLFSGVGGFSIAAHNADFKVVAHCEIEPFPRAVLKYHYPEIPIFNDIKDITKQSFYETTGHRTVDIICGGSPCQDFSTAGKQAGLDGTRSSLFFEQLRVAKELNAKYIIWENVSGALYSKQGADFARILSAFTGYEIQPQKWGNAGMFRAKTKEDYSLCYRIFNSEFFGVPQKRRRIYLVANRGTEPQPEILFDLENSARNNLQM